MRLSFWMGGLRAGLRMLTLRRAYHGMSVLSSYFLARWKIAWLPPRYPLFIGVEPTTACNLHCPQCISGIRGFTRPTGRLSPQTLEALLAELQPYLWGVLFYFQGEPLLHPQIAQLILLASRYRLLTSLSTNGHFLTEETTYALIAAGLTHIRISVDGLTQSTYQQYRQGGDLSQVQAGIETLVAQRQRMRSRFPLIELQMIAFKHNLHEVPLFREWAYKLGADAARIKTAQLLSPDPASYETWIPEPLSRYQRQPDNTLQLKGNLPNHCWRLWRAAEITWDGQVLPCCFDKDAQHSFGSLNGQKFAQLWHSPQAEAFRRTVFQNRKNIDICQNCTEGARTWL
ncbi:MAG: SPASM domain-containing protein [Bacteroidia bacterium]|nr:SPASM domain-containing protein [Bacteroidia bacterium]MDW8235404.1 radical SAM/SPASM domain-containing protein [Bacteroidia bacterium]